MQGTVQKGHVAIGRNDVGAVGLDRDAILNFKDLHAGIAPDQIGEDALVIRRQMLHQHKGHARILIGWHAGKEGLKSRQTTGGSTNADDGKMRMFRCNFSLVSFFNRLFSGCHILLLVETKNRRTV